MLGGASGAIAAPARPAAPPAQHKDKVIPFTRLTGGSAPKIGDFRHYDPRKAAQLPAAGSALVDLSGAAAGAVTPRQAHAAAAGATPLRAGSLPVLIRPGAQNRANGGAITAASDPGQVTVTLTDQKTALDAGVHGILFSVAGADGGSPAGPVTLSVDSSTFKYAYGGDYASRLHLVSLPACVLTTPKVPACQVQTPVTGTAGDALTTTLTPGGGGTTKAAPQLATANRMTVMAATSGSDGASGDYSATSLSASGSWSSSGNTGAFQYDYPIQVPTPIAGPGPKISLGYDSSSQDGRTEGGNNQSSWIGDGWEATTSGYVERTYRTCQDDSTNGAPQYSNDQCWAGQILTLSLNGKSSAIVYDDTTHTFHPKDDNGEKVEQLTSCTNGTYNNECWRITTTDGIQYYFGMNQLPGWSAGKPTTQSAWTVPVYGGHSGDPCHASTFAASSCAQGWRWNLDYVVDPHQNAAAYYYTPETNYYGANMQTTPVSYVRGGWLNRIDYGMTASTVYSATAPEQVVFATVERCVAGTPAGNTCDDSQFTTANAAYWPDVPIDLKCDATGTCNNHGPSYWSRKRLASIVTQIQAGSATQQVDEYDLTQSFPDGGDHAPTLWLDSVQHKGLDTSAGASGTLTNPAVSFDPPLQLPNRVGTVANIPLMYHDRIQDVTTETGEQIAVTYNPASCTPANVPSDPANNTAACYPVYWTPPGNQTPVLDWFHKYSVGSVLTQDQHNKNPDGSFPKLLTSYTYVGGAAWHYDDNETVKPQNRTYGQFRGYATVETRTGDPSVFHFTDGVKVFDQRTLTKVTYLRGMDQNNPTGSGGTGVQVTSQDGKYTVTDSNVLAGSAFETDNYTADGGTIASAQVNLPTVIGPTASRARSGLPALQALMVRPANTYTREAVTGGWRSVESDNFYDTTLGRPTTGMMLQSDSRGDVTDSTQARCTWNKYLTNPATNLVVTAETVVAQQDCTTAGATRTGALVTDSRTSFDGNAFTYDGATPAGTAPTLGDATLAEMAKSASGTMVTVNAMSYDSYGRPAVMTRTPNSTAPDGSSLAQTTTTTYTPTSGALPTQISVKTQVTTGATPTYRTLTTTQDPARGLAVTKVDPSGLRTDLTYDALGRLTAVWLPNESKAAAAPANLTFGYTLSNSGPSVVSTNKLLDNGSYSTEETLYDAMMRERQKQTSAEASNTTVSDTQYDSHGWKVLTNNAYSASGAPGNTLVAPAQSSVPDTTVTDYDGQGRPGLVTAESNGAKTSAVITAFAGDRTTVVQPQGGVTETTFTNALGKTTELDQYTSQPTVTGNAASGFQVSGGTTTATTYSYDPSGKQSQLKGADGSTWQFQYDLLGHKTSVSDPDAGTTTYGYDDAGNQVSVLDSRGIELDYSYDLLGRKLAGRDKNNGNAMFASWLYDTLQVGQLTSTTRYTSGGNYTWATTGYTSLSRPTGTTVTLPASEAPLPTSYSTSYSYSTNQQLLTGQTDQKVGTVLPGEAITYGHTALGNSTSTTSGLWSYLTNTTFTPYNEPSQLTLGPSNNPAYVTYTYDNQTRRLTDALTTRTQAPGPTADEVSYTYDVTGNPLSVSNKQSETGTVVNDNQCFQYDALDRLSQAWTAAGTCPAQGVNPTSGTVATGTGAYWQTFGYDAVGQRKSLVDHAVGGAAGDTTTSYTLGCTGTCPNGTQPHTLTSLSSTGPGGTASQSFGYDKSGNTLSRSVSTTGPLVSGVKGTTGGALCVNDANGVTTDGNPVQIAACSGSTAQNWAVGTDGTVRALGKCLEVTGGGTADGTKVDLATCSGGAGQQWRTQTGGTLVNPASGKCLDDPSNSQTVGTQLDITTCSGAAGQRWTTANAGAQPTSDSTQSFTWDDEGHLGSINTTVNGSTTATTSFVYNADGTQLIRRDPSQTTLFVGDTQITVNTAVTPKVLLGGVRTYSVGGSGAVIAQRSTLPGGGVSYILSDNHGTPTMAMDVNTQAVSRTEYLPYGATRATTGAWPTSSRGFLGASTESGTGYTDVGARKYDPVLGRFMSGDPVLTADNPQEMNGYGYAACNPLARSDASGQTSVGDKLFNWGRDKFAEVFVPAVDHGFHALGKGLRFVDPIVRNVMPKSVFGTPDDPTAIRLGWEWATNTGPKNRDLTNGSRFVSSLQYQSNVQDARKVIAQGVKDGSFNVGTDGESDYHLGKGGGLASLKKMANDFNTTQSGAFLGSYEMSYKVTGIDKKAGTVTVDFQLDNQSTINSCVHTSPAAGGYSNWWNEHIKEPLNKRFEGDGVMSEHDQHVHWTETFSLDDPNADYENDTETVVNLVLSVTSVSNRWANKQRAMDAEGL